MKNFGVRRELKGHAALEKAVSRFGEPLTSFVISFGNYHSLCEWATALQNVDRAPECLIRTPFSTWRLGGKPYTHQHEMRTGTRPGHDQLAIDPV